MSTASPPTTLRMLLGDYPGTHALRSAALRSSLLALDFPDAKVPSQFFKQVVRDLAFEAAELAIVTFLMAKAHERPLVLVPARVGPARFQHQCLVQNIERGRLAPEDLAGKRIGARSWSQTTVTWIRGILAEQYGVPQDSVRWVTFEDAHVAQYRDPPAVERAAADRSMMAMLLAGELDAAIIGNEIPGDPRVQPVIADSESAAREWSRKHRAVPINHMIVVTESLSRSRPDLVRELFRLLKESRAAGPAAADREFDMAPYGVEANRSALQAAIDYSTAQGLLPRKLAVDELFDENTRALS